MEKEALVELAFFLLKIWLTSPKHSSNQWWWFGYELECPTRIWAFRPPSPEFSAHGLSLELHPVMMAEGKASESEWVGWGCRVEVLWSKHVNCIRKGHMEGRWTGCYLFLLSGSLIMWLSKGVLPSTTLIRDQISGTAPSRLWASKTMSGSQALSFLSCFFSGI